VIGHRVNGIIFISLLLKDAVAELGPFMNNCPVCQKRERAIKSGVLGYNGESK
jgi:hypothetical protein